MFLLTLVGCSLLGGDAAPKKSDAPAAAPSAPVASEAPETAALKTASGGCFSGDWSPENHAELEVFVEAGDAAFEFSLQDVDGATHTLSELLEDKPVALFTGSYSCPVYRKKRKQIDRIAKNFGDQLHVVVVHGPEAHPGEGDPSPYRGDSWPLKFSDKPLDRSFEERVELARAVDGSPKTLVLVEPMENPVWCSYGTVPNGAFLIGQDRKLHAVHDWFDPGTFVGSVEALLQ